MTLASRVPASVSSGGVESDHAVFLDCRRARLAGPNIKSLHAISSAFLGGTPYPPILRIAPHLLARGLSCTKNKLNMASTACPHGVAAAVLVVAFFWRDVPRFRSPCDNLPEARLLKLEPVRLTSGEGYARGLASASRRGVRHKEKLSAFRHGFRHRVPLHFPCASRHVPEPHLTSVACQPVCHVCAERGAQ